VWRGIPNKKLAILHLQNATYCFGSAVTVLDYDGETLWATEAPLPEGY
jgi:hypothetical protein